MPEQNAAQQQGGQAATDHWLDKYAETLDGDERKVLEKYDGEASALKGAVAAQRRVGKTTADRLRDEPGLLKEAGLESAEVLRMLGAPEDAKGYEGIGLELGEEIAPEIKEQVSDDRIASFLEASAKAGLLPGQVQALMAWNAEQLQADNAKYQEMVQQARQDLQAAQEQLRSEWGKDHDGNVELAVRAAKEFGSPALAEQVKGVQDVGLVRAFYTLAEAKVKEGTLVTGDGQTSRKGQEDDPFYYPSME